MPYTSHFIISLPPHFVVRFQALLKTIKEVLEQDYKVTIDNGLRYTVGRMNTTNDPLQKIQNTNCMLTPFFPYRFIFSSLYSDNNNLFIDVKIPASFCRNFLDHYKASNTNIVQHDYCVVRTDRPVEQKHLQLLNKYFDPPLEFDVTHAHVSIKYDDISYFFSVNKNMLVSMTPQQIHDQEAGLMRQSREPLRSENLIIPAGTQVFRSSLGPSGGLTSFSGHGPPPFSQSGQFAMFGGSGTGAGGNNTTGNNTGTKPKHTQQTTTSSSVVITTVPTTYTVPPPFTTAGMGSTAAETPTTVESPTRTRQELIGELVDALNETGKQPEGAASNPDETFEEEALDETIKNANEKTPFKEANFVASTPATKGGATKTLNFH